MLPTFFDRIERFLFEPHHDAPQGLRLLFGLLRYPFALLHDIAAGQLSLRAMSMVYTTLLSVVPLLALSFSVLKGLGYHRDLEPVLYQFLEPMGDRAFEITSQVMQFVDNARGGVLGTLGFAFLLYTAVSMIQKVEESFNMVWRVQKPRSLGRRISEYISVLIVGPIIIITALTIMANVSDTGLVRRLATSEPFGTLLVIFGYLTPYLLVAGAFTFLYAFIPNTKVRFRAAAIAGSIAGVVWLGSGAIFASFVSRGNTTMLIYAGFAVVLLALLWLYISWLILLIGAQFAFYIQNPQYLRPGSDVTHLTPSGSERLALSMMYLLAKEFAQPANEKRTAHTTNSLAERLYVPVSAIAPVVRSLESAGLIVAADDDRWLPGRDLSSIQLAEILDAVRNDRADRAMRHVSAVAAADAVAKAAADAMHASLKMRTLKDLIDE
ncbi:MAG TPA: YihY/virulence factor BrkB family protein [Steroidobacteraceae bacterium]|nr:YihY/virulence factor BrkB family protein [Steroidobacteraceae bacterium]